MGRARAEEGRERGGPAQGPGPTGVSGAGPRHKGPRIGGYISAGGDTPRSPRSPSPGCSCPGRGLGCHGPHPSPGGRGAHGHGHPRPGLLRRAGRLQARTRHPAPFPPRPGPVPGLHCRGHDPRPRRAPSPGRATPGPACRPLGVRRHRVLSPWRPEEAAVCAARRTKRGAPLPAIVRPRPPPLSAGTPGRAGPGTAPSPPGRRTPPSRPGPRHPAPGIPASLPGNPHTPASARPGDPHTRASARPGVPPPPASAQTRGPHTPTSARPGDPHIPASAQPPGPPRSHLCLAWGTPTSAPLLFSDSLLNASAGHRGLLRTCSFPWGAP